MLGTERHESRRIDNQLRGRSGRQGDPGHSKFFLSMEDDLMRIFGGERMDSLMQKFGFEEGESLVHPWLNRAVEKSQEKVEARNYEIRKNLLKFDNVMNDQRKAIYDQRRDVMISDDLTETLTDMRIQVIDDLVTKHIPPRAYPQDWDVAGMGAEATRIFGRDFGLEEWIKEDGIDEEGFEDRLIDETDRFMAKRAADIGPDIMRQVERSILLQAIDRYWKEHLSQLDHLRQVIQLRAYGQRDPLNEYKTEAFSMFENMLEETRDNVVLVLSHIEIQREQPVPELKDPDLSVLNTSHMDATTGENDAVGINPDDPKSWGMVPRNSLCPCGSGKKYKHCHGKVIPVSGPNTATQKVGRNDPCPCNSGKKYKHCHGAL